ncbi:Tfp pilus assembly protein FimT/FimU [Verrucomicrobiota bacterium]
MVRLMHKQSGFTLIELMLVLMILGFVAAVTVPMLSGSIGKNRLRTASGTVVTAGRYARSMAVLRQQDVALIFDIDSGTVSVVSASIPGQSSESDTLSEPGEESVEHPDVEDNSGNEGEALKDNLDFLCRLEGIKIEYVEMEDKDNFTEGTCSVVYSCNGRCTPYGFKLVDEKGFSITIAIDALSAVRTREENM